MSCNKVVLLSVLYSFASPSNLLKNIYICIKERKILKDEVQQDGKNANTSQPGIEPGTPADAAGALPTELPEPGPKPNQNE